MNAGTQARSVLYLTTDLQYNILSHNHLVPAAAGLNEAIVGKKMQHVFPLLQYPDLEKIKDHCLHHPNGRYTLQMPSYTNHPDVDWAVSLRLNEDTSQSLQWVGMPSATSAQQPFHQAFSHTSGQALVLLDAHLAVKEMNAAAEKFYGLSSAEAKGRRLIALLSFKLETGTDTEAIALLQEKGAWKGRFTFVNVKGERRCCQSYVRRVGNKDETYGFVAVDNDITADMVRNENVGVAQALHDIMEGISNQSGTLMWAADAEGRLRYFNEPFAQLYGLAPTDVGKPLTDIFDAATAEAFGKENTLLVSEGNRKLSLEERTLPNGEKGIFRMLKFPVQTPAGCFAAGIALDVTQMAQEQAAIINLKTRYEQAALISTDIISDWDIVADRLWRSDPQKGMLVHKVKAATINDRYQRVHPEDLARFKHSLKSALDSAAKNWECQYRYKQGRATNEYKVLHEKAVILRNDQGIAIRMISVVEDVTEKERMKMALQDTERQIIAATIEGQEAERNELARELHDNVGQILAMCRLFLDVAADAVQHEYLNKCRTHLDKAVQEIRSLSHRLSPETLDRKGLPKAITDLVANINQTGKLQVSLEIAPGLLCKDLQKPVQMAVYRIIQEKISNILKHSCATKAQISLHVEKELLLVQISDNGKGFDPASVKAGIGLRNIYNRAEFAGGRAELHSSPGAGCQLQVELPLTQ